VFAAVRTFDSNCIDIRTVKLYRQRIGIAALFCQFGAAADGLLMAALTLPDIQGSTPVTVPGDGPVLDILQPVAKTSLADGFRDPVHRVIIADQVVADCRLLNIPGLPGIVNQGSIT